MRRAAAHRRRRRPLPAGPGRTSTPRGTRHRVPASPPRTRRTTSCPARAGRAGAHAGRAVGAVRHLARGRRRGPAVLRLAAGQGDRLGRRPGRGDRAAPGGRSASSRSRACKTTTPLLSAHRSTRTGSRRPTSTPERSRQWLEGNRSPEETDHDHHRESSRGTRYSWGGDEHVFVELDEEMSLQANFRAMAITRALREQTGRTGVFDICPANASYQVRYDPDVVDPHALVDRLRRLDDEMGDAHDLPLSTRIVEIPVLYQDPGPRDADAVPGPPPGPEGDRHRVRRPDQRPVRAGRRSSTRTRGSPWFASMVGFVAGLPFLFQMVPRERQLEVPKYLRPRTDTPEADRRPRRLLRLHLLGARGRRLPDVRHHAGADLRPERRSCPTSATSSASSGRATS